MASIRLRYIDTGTGLAAGHASVTEAQDGHLIVTLAYDYESPADWEAMGPVQRKTYLRQLAEHARSQIGALTMSGGVS